MLKARAYRPEARDINNVEIVLEERQCPIEVELE
jgi:hypothetical protein